MALWSSITVAALLAFTTPPGVAKTPFVVAAEDGVELYAVEYRADAAEHRRTVVLTGDGYEGCDTADLDALAEALFGRGLDVVVWDRRGTGRSGGQWDYGLSDQEDLMTMVRAVDKRTFGHEIGLLGLGSGGVAALQVAAQTAKVQAVAVYGVGIAGAGERWTSFTHPGALPGKLLLRLQGVRAGPYAEAPQPESLAEVIKNIRRRPVFISVGGHASRVGQQEAQELYRLAQPPKEWGFAPSGGDEVPTAMVASQVVDFFVRRLR